MTTNTTEKKISFSVAEAVKERLTQKEKSLPSWLFYDAEGDRLFQEIRNIISQIVNMIYSKNIKMIFYPLFLQMQRVLI